MSDPIEIDDGMRTFALPGGRTVTLDLPAFQCWAGRWKAPDGADGWAFTEAVREYVRSVCGGAVLTFGEADGLIAGVEEAAKALREQRESLRG